MRFILLFTVVLLNAGVLSASPPGDEHAALLEEEMNDLAAASSLLVHCVQERRSNAEVVNAMNVLADNVELTCAHYSQFYLWIDIWSKRGSQTSEFSIAAQRKTDELITRFLGGQDLQAVSQAMHANQRYNSDPGVVAAANRMFRAAKGTQILLSKGK